MKKSDYQLHPFSYKGREYFYSSMDHRIYNKYREAPGNRPLHHLFRPKININTMWLNLTDNCNLACRYCFNPPEHHREKSLFMTNEVARQAIILLGKLWNLNKNRKPAKVIFFGGEPLLNPEVLQYTVHFAKEWTRISGVPYAFSISTNGTILNEKISNFLVNEDFIVQLSIDGPRAIHDRHRIFPSGLGSYETIMKNLKYLLNRPSLKMFVRSTIAEGTLPVSSNLRFFCDAGFKMVNFKFINDNTISNADITDSEFDLLQNDIDNVVAELLRARKKGLHINPFEEHIGDIINGSWGKFICGAGIGIISIDPEGWIYPCHRFHGNLEYRISHVSEKFNSKIPEIFLSLRAEDIPQCKSCWAIKFCLGCCPAESIAFNKKLCHPHEAWCRMKRLEAETSLRFAAAIGLVEAP